MVNKQLLKFVQECAELTGTFWNNIAKQIEMGEWAKVAHIIDKDAEFILKEGEPFEWQKENKLYDGWCCKAMQEFSDRIWLEPKKNPKGGFDNGHFFCGSRMVWCPFCGTII